MMEESWIPLLQGALGLLGALCGAGLGARGARKAQEVANEHDRAQREQDRRDAADQRRLDRNADLVRERYVALRAAMNKADWHIRNVRVIEQMDPFSSSNDGSEEMYRRMASLHLQRASEIDLEIPLAEFQLFAPRDTSKVAEEQVRRLLQRMSSSFEGFTDKADDEYREAAGELDRLFRRDLGVEPPDEDSGQDSRPKA